MTGVVPHRSFHPDGLGGYGKVHFQGDRLANSNAGNAAKAEATFGDAIGLRAEGGDLLLPYHADH